MTRIRKFLVVASVFVSVLGIPAGASAGPISDTCQDLYQEVKYNWQSAPDFCIAGDDL